jgi:hypothetical protein
MSSETCWLRISLMESQLRAKIAQIARRFEEDVSLQTVLLDGLRVLSRDAISNLHPRQFSLVAGNRRYSTVESSTGARSIATSGRSISPSWISSAHLPQASAIMESICRHPASTQPTLLHHIRIIAQHAYPQENAHPLELRWHSLQLRRREAQARAQSTHRR